MCEHTTHISERTHTHTHTHIHTYAHTHTFPPRPRRVFVLTFKHFQTPRTVFKRSLAHLKVVFKRAVFKHLHRGVQTLFKHCFQTGGHVSPSPSNAPTRSEASFPRQEGMPSRFYPSGSHVKPVYPGRKPCANTVLTCLNCLDGSPKLFKRLNTDRATVQTPV